MKKIPLSIYVAANNPSGAHRILDAWDAHMPSDSTQIELANALSSLVHAFGAGPLEDMAFNHPDREIILAAERTHQNLLMQRNTSFNQVNQLSADGSSNACGCSGFGGQSNACGCSSMSSCDGGCKCGGKCKGNSSFNGGDVQRFTVFEHPFDGEKKPKGEGMYPVVLGSIVFFGLLYVICHQK